MQIPSINLAASLAGLTGKPSSESSASVESASNQLQSQVEQSSESNPDRDAQGQGDGLNRPSAGKQPPTTNQLSTSADPCEADACKSAPILPDDPPSQLDLLG